MNQEEEKSTKLKKIVKMVNKSEMCSIRNIVSGVIKIINDPKSSAKDLKEIIQIDPPLTGKLLKLANSVLIPSEYTPHLIKCVLASALIRKARSCCFGL